MIEATGHTTIARPIEEVFDYVADARNEPKWLPGAERVEKTTSGPVGLGTMFEGVYARAGRVSLEIVEFDRPRRLTFRARARIVRFDDAVSLTEQDDGTHLDARMDAQPVGVMRVFAPLIARTMKKQFAANWDTLRDALQPDGSY